MNRCFKMILFLTGISLFLSVLLNTRLFRSDKTVISIKKLLRFLEVPKSPEKLLGLLEQTSKMQEFRYSVEGGPNASKAFLNVNQTYLSSLCFPPASFIDVKDISLEKLVFVIAASSNHYYESLAGVESVQQFFPTNTLVYYDIGLTKAEAQEVKQMCGVTYKQLDFTKHPKHIKRLLYYAWKTLLVLDVLCHADWIIWMDASVRFISNDLTSTYNIMYKTGGFASYIHSGHSIFAATNPKMYDYLPIDLGNAKTNEMSAATSLAFARTKEMYKDIIFWWVLCALQEDCIALGQLSCGFNPDRYKFYAGCHRYDQSALAIIASNQYHKISKFAPKQIPVKVERGGRNRMPLKMCKSKSDDGMN